MDIECLIKAFTVGDDRMVMQNDLDLNGHRVRGAIHHIHGFSGTESTAGRRFSLNG